MEAQAALVGADGALELHPVAVVGVGDPLVIHPGHQEGEHPVGFHHAGEQVQLFVLGVVQGGIDHLQPGEDRLEVLRLVGVALPQLGGDTDSVLIHVYPSLYHTVGQHGVGHLQEAGDVGPCRQVAGHAVLGGGVRGAAVHVAHDAL